MAVWKALHQSDVRLSGGVLTAHYATAGHLVAERHPARAMIGLCAHAARAARGSHRFAVPGCSTWSRLVRSMPSRSSVHYDAHHARAGPKLSAARHRRRVCRQPPSGQRETIARVLGLLAAELRRRRAACSTSRRQQWQAMACYGITEADVRRTV